MFLSLFVQRTNIHSLNLILNKTWYIKTFILSDFDIREHQRVDNTSKGI